MDARRLAVRVGLFVAVGVALTIGLARLVVGGSLFGLGGYEVTAVVPDASCIVPGTQVQIAGVPVGRVLSRELAPNGAKLTMLIEDERIVLSDRAVFRKRTAGPIGIGKCYVDLAPRG